MSNPRVLLISARMGSGHDGAAKQIALRLERQGVDTEIVDFLDASPRFGSVLENLYRLEVERAQWAYDIEFWLWNHVPLLTPFARSMFERFFQRRTAQWITDFQPDLIICLHPFASQLIGQMRKRQHPAVKSIPTATFLTDFSVHPLWIHPSIDLHLCVSTTAYEQALLLAGSHSRVLCTGPFVDETFFHPTPRSEARRLLDIPSQVNVALIVAGSWGVGDITETFTLLTADPNIYPIAICGYNDGLRASLGHVPGGKAVGWTDEIGLYLSASDVVVQNAGGLTALEAMATGTPVLSYRPIAGHGVENVASMVDAGVTQLATSPRELISMIERVIADPNQLVETSYQQFMAEPEAPILELFHTPQPHRRSPSRRTRRLTRASASIAAVFVGANLLSGVIGYRGLNLDRTAATTDYVYLSVLANPSSLRNSTFDSFLARNDIAVIATGVLAKDSPGAIASAAAAGVTILNGGSGRSSDFNFILPSNDLSSTRAVLDRILGTPVNVYVPQNTINAVDLAWASLHHQSVVPAHILVPSTAKASARPNGIYEYDVRPLSVDQAITRLHAVLRLVRRSNLTVPPFATISSLTGVAQ
ncbi:MAG: MGDG synthase family glycosyltransferase [Ferrimicrobium sp.]